MHRAWVERVADDDTIICLGDVSVDGCLRPHHVIRWRQAPGFKVLVLGNHEHKHGMLRTLTHAHVRFFAASACLSARSTFP